MRIGNLQRNGFKGADILLLFVLSRAFFLIIMVVSGTGLREIINSFDAEHYRSLAEFGYYDESLTAFFPLVPMLIRYLKVPGMLIINNLAFVGSLVLIKRLTNGNLWIMISFALSPIGFFSMLLYTESLFVFFTLYAYSLFAGHSEGFLMGILIGLSVMVRNAGSLFFAAVFLGMCIRWYRRETSLMRIIKTYIPATLLAVIYPIFLQLNFDNWKIFVDCQYDYWIRIHSSLPRTIMMGLKVIFTDAYSYPDFGSKLICSINEGLSLILLIPMLYFPIRTLIGFIRQRRVEADDFVLSLYMLLSVLVFNSSVRDPAPPLCEAPTTSFYRYYYAVFPAFIMLRGVKTHIQQIAMGLTVGISLLTSFIFCAGLFFY